MLKYEVMLNLFIKCHAGLLWTGPCGAKLRPILSNRHM